MVQWYRVNSVLEFLWLAARTSDCPSPTYTFFFVVLERRTESANDVCAERLDDGGGSGATDGAERDVADGGRDDNGGCDVVGAEGAEPPRDARAPPDDSGEPPDDSEVPLDDGGGDTAKGESVDAGDGDGADGVGSNGDDAGDGDRDDAVDGAEALDDGGTPPDEGGVGGVMVVVESPLARVVASILRSDKSRARIGESFTPTKVSPRHRSCAHMCLYKILPLNVGALCIIGGDRRPLRSHPLLVNFARSEKSARHCRCKLIYNLALGTCWKYYIQYTTLRCRHPHPPTIVM